MTDWNAFKEFGEYVAEMVAATEHAKKAGKTAEQAATDLKLPDKFKNYNTSRLKDDVNIIYAELK